MNRRKVYGIVLLATAALALASVAYAVLITLASTDIAQIGGTPQVNINCPANPCQVTRVTWTIGGPPFRVTHANVQWTPALDSPASYTVYVVLYDNSGGVISSGSATQPGSSSSVTTNVPVSPPAIPAQIHSVEIVIVQN